MPHPCTWPGNVFLKDIELLLLVGSHGFLSRTVVREGDGNRSKEYVLVVKYFNRYYNGMHGG